MPSGRPAVRSRCLAVGALLLAPAARLASQCPDGTPPPCRGATIGGAPKRANLPLDDRTWIVVPFDNLARSQELEWLRAASVNLLYLDLSQWREVHVVDDERVADLIKEGPERGGSVPLSLSSGLAIARRAGAGRLVMGDLLKVGTRIGVVAKIFDVRSGQRLRSVRDEATSPDSMMPLFGRLARGILNVPAQSRQSADIGTTSIEAYREYVAGVQALNAFDLPDAHRRFEKSLQLDSSFALPHYKLSIVIGWENPSDPARRRHAEAAARLGGGLPVRERALISGQRKFSIGEYASACDDYRGLVGADSSDVEALYGLGECSFRDDVVEFANTDSSTRRFRGSWNTAAHAFRRVLALDPGNYLAFQQVLDLLSAETRSGCVRGASSAPCLGQTLDYISAVRRDADSVLLVPVHVALDATAEAEQMDERGRTNVRVRNLEEARVLAEEWAGLAPRAARAHTSLAHVYLLLGRLDDAEREFALAKGTFAPIVTFQILLDRLEIAIRRGDGARALAFLDSAARTFRGQPAPTSVTMSLALANSMVGRFARIDSVFEGLGGFMPAALVRYYHVGLRAVISGTGTDSVGIVERQAYDIVAPRAGAARATTFIVPTLALGLRFPRTGWPEIVVDPRDHGMWSVVALAPLALARRDTQALRIAMRALDSMVAAPGAGLSRVLASYAAADTHLILLDSLGALNHLRRLVDSAFTAVPITSTLSAGFDAPGVAYPRAILERANLARALGFTDEAREWYRRFLDLWAKADPEFAPFIAGVRARYESLAPRP